MTPLSITINVYYIYYYTTPHATLAASSGAGCHTGLARALAVPFRYASMWSQSFALHESFINESTRKLRVKHA